MRCSGYGYLFFPHSLNRKISREINRIGIQQKKHETIICVKNVSLDYTRISSSQQFAKIQLKIQFARMPFQQRLFPMRLYNKLSRGKLSMNIKSYNQK